MRMILRKTAIVLIFAILPVSSVQAGGKIGKLFQRHMEQLFDGAPSYNLRKKFRDPPTGTYCDESPDIAGLIRDATKQELQDVIVINQNNSIEMWASEKNGEWTLS